MANDKIVVELNKKNEYQISVNGAVLSEKYQNKMTAIEQAVKLGRENPNTTDVTIRADY